MMDRRKLEVTCIHETKGAYDDYNVMHAGGDGKSNGVCHSIREVCKDVVGVEKLQRRIIVAWIMVETATCLHNVCVCVLKQEGWREREKGLHGRA